MVFDEIRNSKYINGIKDKDGGITEHLHPEKTPDSKAITISDRERNKRYRYPFRLPYSDIDIVQEDINNYDNPGETAQNVITMRSILNDSNIFDGDQIHGDRFNKFARYGILDPSHECLSAREYLFFSKPDLHIFDVHKSFELYEPLKKSPYFLYAKEQNPASLLSLQQTFDNESSSIYPNGFNVKNKFIPLLSNQVASTLDLPGITASETLTNTNLYQIGTSYRDGSEISDYFVDFSLMFRDTKYLDVYNFFKAYDEYHRQEYMREIRPTKNAYIKDMINYKQFSIWKIVVDDTNTIIFFAKIIGVHPLSVPRDGMSNFEPPISETITFKGQIVRDLNPYVFTELNHLTELSLGINGLGKDDKINTINSKAIKLYNTKKAVPNTKWGSYPYIVRKGKKHGTSGGEGDLYKLIWLQ